MLKKWVAISAKIVLLRNAAIRGYKQELYDYNFCKRKRIFVQPDILSANVISWIYYGVFVCFMTFVTKQH